MILFIFVALPAIGKVALMLLKPFMPPSRGTKVQLHVMEGLQQGADSQMHSY